MTSLLETTIKNQVASAFKNRLLTGTLRRMGSYGLNDFGDPVDSTATTYTFDGIRDSFNASYAAAAGIPVTDVRVLIIAGSLSVDPVRGDQIKIRDQWHEVREIRERDPANATHILQCFEIDDPTS